MNRTYEEWMDWLEMEMNILSDMDPGAYDFDGEEIRLILSQEGCPESVIERIIIDMGRG
jgi:hypothetical protein